MKFRKFESIENTYNSKNISKIIYNGYDKGEWIVTEKLHGANFSIYIEKGVVMNFGSRNQFVDGSFYESADLQKELKEGIEDGLFRALYAAEQEVKILYNKAMPVQTGSNIIIYGELVGERVQKEVYYCDDLMFYMFDMVADGEVVDKDVARSIWNHMYQYAYTVPLLHKGTFADCCSMSNELNSNIAKRGNNMAEGIIIEPITPTYYNNDKRILLKNKTRQFSEKNDGVINVYVITELSEKDTKIFYELLTYLNKNRLNAVKSKGHPEKAVPHMLVKDIFEEYNKDNEHVYSSDSLRTDCDDYKRVMRQLQMEVNKFINGDV